MIQSSVLRQTGPQGTSGCLATRGSVAATQPERGRPECITAVCRPKQPGMVISSHLCILINNNFKAFPCNCTNIHYAVKCLLQSICSFIIKITKQTRHQTFQVSSHCVCSLSLSSNCWKCEDIIKPPLIAMVGQPLERIPLVRVPILSKSSSCWWISRFVLSSTHTVTFHDQHRGKQDTARHWMWPLQHGQRWHLTIYIYKSEAEQD